MRRKGKLRREFGTIVFLLFVVFLPSGTLSAQEKSTLERELVEAQKIVGQYLRHEAGTKWLSDLAKTKSSPITTMDLMSAIIVAVPEGGRVWRAATKLSKALKEHKFPEGASYDSLALQNDSWKDLITNIEMEDDIVCLYRKSSNETTKRSDDWKKFLKAITPGYTVHLALDTGRKYVICLKKIRIPETTLPPTTTTLKTTTSGLPSPATDKPARLLYRSLEKAPPTWKYKIRPNDNLCDGDTNGGGDDDEDSERDFSEEDDSSSERRSLKRKSRRCSKDYRTPLIIVVPTRDNYLPVNYLPPTTPYWNYFPMKGYQRQGMVYSPYRSARPSLRYSLPNYENDDFFFGGKMSKFRAFPGMLSRMVAPPDGRNVQKSNGNLQARSQQNIPIPPTQTVKPEVLVREMLSKSPGRFAAEAIFQEVGRQVPKNNENDLQARQRAARKQIAPWFVNRFRLPVGSRSDYIPEMACPMTPWNSECRFPTRGSRMNDLVTRYYPNNHGIGPQRSPPYVQNRLKDDSTLLRPIASHNAFHHRPFARPSAVSLRPNRPSWEPDPLQIVWPPTDFSLQAQNGDKTARRIARIFPIYPRQRFNYAPINYRARPGFVRPNILPISIDYCRNLWNRLLTGCRMALPIAPTGISGPTGSSNCDSPITLKILVNGQLTEPVKIVANNENNARIFPSGRRSMSNARASVPKNGVSTDDVDMDMLAEEFSLERKAVEENYGGIVPMERTFSPDNDSIAQTTAPPEVSKHSTGSKRAADLTTAAPPTTVTSTTATTKS